MWFSGAQKPHLKEERAIDHGSLFIGVGLLTGALPPTPQDRVSVRDWPTRSGRDRLWNQDAPAGQTAIVRASHTKDSISRTKSIAWAPKPCCPLAPSPVSFDGDIA